MQFVIVARDDKSAGTIEKRLAARSEHMAGIKAMKGDGRIIDGGAILDERGDMSGSVVLCEFEDRSALDSYLASEPYSRDGVWKDVEIIELRRVDWAKLMAD